MRRFFIALAGAFSFGFGALLGFYESWAVQIGLGMLYGLWGTLLAAGVVLFIDLVRGKSLQRNRRYATPASDNEHARLPDDPLTDNYWLDRGRPNAAPGLPHMDELDPTADEP